MKKFAHLILLLLFPAFASATGDNKKLDISLNDSSGGGSIVIDLTPSALAGSSTKFIVNNSTNYVVYESYQVSGDAKYVKAVYELYEGTATNPIIINKMLPINYPPKPINIGYGLTAMATKK